MKPALCLLGCLLLAPSVHAQRINVDFDKEVDFSHIKRYQWRTHPAYEKHPELKGKYATGIQLVLEAGNTQLMKKGLRPSDRPPDVFVTFYLAAEDDVTTRTITEAAPGAWYGWWGMPTWTYTEVDYFKSGVLVLDVVDAATSKLIWRAYCTDTVRDMAHRDKNINDAVRKALDKFPPKHK